MDTEISVALWKIWIEALNEGGCVDRVLYAITDRADHVPDPHQAIKTALPGEVIFQVNSINLLCRLQTASAEVCPYNPLTQLAHTMIKEQPQ